MIPFLVADRPASLNIISGLETKYESIKIGLMGHANTSENFQKYFARFPCVTNGVCNVIKDECPYNGNLKSCKEGLIRRNSIIKMCDSGIFQKNGCNMNYDELFNLYDLMNTNYGVIKDELKNKNITLESAIEAIKIYREKSYNFNLVGVAQGKSVREYIDCYDDLKSLGYDYIAVGGLLKKRNNTVRYTFVSNTNFMENVLSSIREKYKNDWIYVLGCYHPKRHDLLLNYNVYGSDYKGWIFQYDIGRGKKSKISSDNKERRRKSRYQQVRTYLKSIYNLPQN